MTVQFDIQFVRPGSDWPDGARGSVTISLADFYAAIAAFAVATSQEEIGYSGGGARTSAWTLDPEVGLVVDVTFSTDVICSCDSRMKSFGSSGLSRLPARTEP